MSLARFAATTDHSKGYVGRFSDFTTRDMHNLMVCFGVVFFVFVILKFLSFFWLLLI